MASSGAGVDPVVEFDERCTPGGSAGPESSGNEASIVNELGWSGAGNERTKGTAPAAKARPTAARNANKGRPVHR